MDLFGCAPNLKCSNEAVCYNAVSIRQTPFNRRELLCVGSDCTVLEYITGDKSSFLFWTQNTLAHQLTQVMLAFEQSFNIHQRRRDVRFLSRRKYSGF